MIIKLITINCKIINKIDLRISKIKIRENLLHIVRAITYNSIQFKSCIR